MSIATLLLLVAAYVGVVVVVVAMLVAASRADEAMERWAAGSGDVSLTHEDAEFLERAGIAPQAPPEPPPESSVVGRAANGRPRRSQVG